MFTFLTSPQSQSVVPGQDITFTSQASSNDVVALSAAYTYQWYTSASNVNVPTLISNATESSYVFDPLIDDNGLRFFVTATFLSGAPANTFVQRITSAQVVVTVAEDISPYDVFDSAKETGRERYRRLRHLGYI